MDRSSNDVLESMANEFLSGIGNEQRLFYMARAAIDGTAHVRVHGVWDEWTVTLMLDPSSNGGLAEVHGSAPNFADAANAALCKLILCIAKYPMEMARVFGGYRTDNDPRVFEMMMFSAKQRTEARELAKIINFPTNIELEE